MLASKDRLYIALYARGGKGYHWTLLTVPKSDKPNELGKRYHAKQRQMSWEFNEEEIKLAPTNMILARVLIAKVKDKKKFKATLRNIPIRPEVPGWTCKSWVEEAFEALKDVQAISCSFDWDTVSQTALCYVRYKAENHRYDGLAQAGYFDGTKVATWDMLDEKEIIP